ncbi:MAG: Uncharacterized protein FD149_819 [Rhodospirillaceae bacterium]|nr:MAG: Uncharacterized protein FD149_819 [Rhodospirillaceae bacterium]
MSDASMEVGGGQTGHVRDTKTAIEALVLSHTTNVDVADLDNANVTKISVTGDIDAAISLAVANALTVALIENTAGTGPDTGIIRVTDTALALTALFDITTLGGDPDLIISGGAYNALVGAGYVDFVLKDTDGNLKNLLDGKSASGAAAADNVLVLSEFVTLKGTGTGTFSLASDTNAITITTTQADLLKGIADASFLANGQKVSVSVADNGALATTLGTDQTFWKAQGITHVDLPDDANDAVDTIADSIITVTAANAALLITNGIKIYVDTGETAVVQGTNVTDVLAFITAANTAALGTDGQPNTFDDGLSVTDFGISSVTVAGGGDLTLDISQVGPFATSGIKLDPSLNVTVNVTWGGTDGGGLLPLLGSLGAINVDNVVISTGSNIKLNVTQAQALLASGLTLSLSGENTIILEDSGTNIAKLTKGQAAALATIGIHEINLTGTGGTATLTVDRAVALGSNGISFMDSRSDIVIVSDTLTALNSLDAAKIADLDAANVKFLDSRTDAATLTTAQANALASAGIAYVAGDDVVLKGTSALLATAFAGGLAAKLGEIGVDAIESTDATSNTLILTPQVIIDLAVANVAVVTNASSVEVAGTAAELSALDPADVHFLTEQGITVAALTNASGDDAVDAAVLAAFAIEGIAIEGIAIIPDGSAALKVALNASTAARFDVEQLQDAADSYFEGTLAAADIAVEPGARLTVAQFQTLNELELLDPDLIAAGAITIADSYAELRAFLDDGASVENLGVVGGLVLTDTIGTLTNASNKSLFVAMRNEALNHGLDFGGAIEDSAAEITTYFGANWPWQVQDQLGRLFVTEGQWGIPLGEGGVSEIQVTEGAITLSGKWDQGTGWSLINKVMQASVSWNWVDQVESAWLRFDPATSVTAVLSQSDLNNTNAASLAQLGVSELKIIDGSQSTYYDAPDTHLFGTTVTLAGTEGNDRISPQKYADLVNGGITITPAPDDSAVATITGGAYITATSAQNTQYVPYLPGSTITAGTNEGAEKSLDYSGTNDLTVDLRSTAADYDQVTDGDTSKVTGFKHLLASNASGNVTVNATGIGTVDDPRAIKTGSGDDTITLGTTGQNRIIDTDGGDDTLNGTVDASDSILLGSGNDTIAVTGVGGPVTAGVNAGYGIDTFQTTTGGAFTLPGYSQWGTPDNWWSAGSTTFCTGTSTKTLSLASVENLDASTATGAVTVTLGGFGHWDYGSVNAANVMFVTTGGGDDVVYAGRSDGASHTLTLGGGADTVYATEENEGWWGAAASQIDFGEDSAADVLRYDNFYALQNRGQSNGQLVNLSYDKVSNFDVGNDRIMFGGNFTYNLDQTASTYQWWPAFNIDKDASGGIDFAAEGETVDLVLSEAGIIDVGGALTKKNILEAAQENVALAELSQTRGLLVFTGTDGAVTPNDLSSVYLFRDDNYNGNIDDVELVHIADVQGALTDANFGMVAAGAEEGAGLTVTTYETGISNSSGAVTLSSMKMQGDIPSLRWDERIKIVDTLGDDLAITTFASVAVTGDADDRATALQQAVEDYLAFRDLDVTHGERAALLFRYTDDSTSATDYTLFVEDGDGVKDDSGTMIGATQDLLVSFTADDNTIEAPWSFLSRSNLTDLTTDQRMVTGSHTTAGEIDAGSATLVSTGGVQTAWNGAKD